MNTIHDASPDIHREIPLTMQAIARDRYGEADELELRTVDVPDVGADEVLIEVHAAGVDRGVWHLMTGLPYLVRLAGFGVTAPKQPVIGMDVSGRVAAIGSDVTRFRVGDEVFGIGSGTFAEFAVAQEAKLAVKPTTVSFEEAAAAAISGITALQALRDVGHIEAGQRVLVVGASGGVGTFAVQLAKHFGTHVTGVSSTAKLDLVRSLGADRVVDYSREDAFDGAERYDLIVDVGGRTSVTRLRRALTRTGTVVIVGGEDGGKVTGGIGRQLRAMALSLLVRQRLTTFISKERGADIEAVGALLATGELVAAVDRVAPLAAAPETMVDLAAGRLRGKAVVQVVAPETSPV